MEPVSSLPYSQAPNNNNNNNRQIFTKQYEHHSTGGYRNYIFEAETSHCNAWIHKQMDRLTHQYFHTIPFYCPKFTIFSVFFYKAITKHRYKNTKKEVILIQNNAN